MPRPLTGLLVSAFAFVLCGAAYAVQTGAVPNDQRQSSDPPAEQALIDPVPNDDDGDQLVVLFGDSLTELAIEDARSQFADDPALRLSAHAYGGTELDTEAWVDRYPNVGDGSVVLLFLGINDLFAGSVDQTRRDATEAIDALTAAGAERVVMTTINSTGSPTELGPDWLDKVREMNGWLVEADRNDQRFPTLEVARWDVVSQGRTDWLRPDGVHFTEAGAAAYADHIHEAAALAADTLA